MISDFYSVSYLPIRKNESIDELNIISRYYRSHRVRRIFLTREYDPSITVKAHIARESHYFASARKSLCSQMRLIPIHSVTLFKGISGFPDLELLALKTKTGSYLYVNVPFGIDHDTLASELHTIIYKKKLIPVFISIETLQQICSEQVFDTILSVPNAVYQISLNHVINNKSVDKLLKRLLKEKKNVIFGSGDGFDACPYKNIEFYLKYIKKAVGKDIFGYFLIRHNRMF